MQNPKDLILAPDLTKNQIHEILTAHNFSDPDRADRNLQLIADEPPFREAFAEIVEDLLSTLARCPDPDAALNHFERFSRVTFNRLWLYKLLKDAPFLHPNVSIIHLVAICFGSSDYFADILVRNPEYFDELISADAMSIPKNYEIMFDEISHSINLAKSVDRKLEALRRYKRKESLRIGLRDLLDNAEIETTTLELSNLAQTTLQHCYAIGDAVMREKYGDPNADFCVIAMGKFGGGELNFSSDIDVIFVHSHDAKTELGYANRDYFEDLSKFIFNRMSEMTVGGYVFRVDVRLRPESSAGAISRSIDSYEAYYESWGEIWERQALIKARPVAGNLDLGYRFVKMVQPFVYRRYLDEFSIAEIKLDIRQTKSRIEKKIAEKGSPKNHVKLGPGGIRDIEFTIQCLQMIHGGPMRILRSRNTLKAIDFLFERDLLSKTDRETLSTAYRFFRRIEHRIQMETDQQKYRIPHKTRDLLKLAKTCGYDAIDDFQSDYEKQTIAVRKIFDTVLKTHVAEGEVDLPLLLTTQESQPLRDLLDPYGFQNAVEAQRRLRLMAEGSEGIRFSPIVRRRFSAIATKLLQLLSEVPDPDTALRYVEDFASKVGARSSYYALFHDNPSILEMLTKICGTSVFLAEILVNHPESFDILTAPAIAHAEKTFYQQKIETGTAIKNKRIDQLYQALQHHKNSEILRIGARKILDISDLWTATAELSDLAEAILQTAFDRVVSDFREKNGEIFDENENKIKIAAIALGKFGGRDLNFSSDLDLIFAYADEGKTENGMTASEYFSGLVLELTKLLNGEMGMPIYDVDLRLRPHGNSGAIAMSINSYKNYYKNHGELWERQALIRTKVIAGDREVGDRFIEIASDFAYRSPITHDEITQIVHTRKRKEKHAIKTTRSRRTSRRRGNPRNVETHNVKSGYGGLVDVEFAVQVLQLKFGSEFPTIRTPNTRTAIDRLREIDALTEDQADQLLRSYEFLRIVENSLRIVHDRPLHALPTKTAELNALAKRVGYDDDQKFLQRYHDCTHQTRQSYNQLLDVSE